MHMQLAAALLLNDIDDFLGKLRVVHAASSLFPNASVHDLLASPFADL